MSNRNLFQSFFIAPIWAQLNQYITFAKTGFENTHINCLQKRVSVLFKPMYVQLSEQEKKAEDNSLIKGAPFKDIIHPLKLNIEFYRKSVDNE